MSGLGNSLWAVVIAFVALFVWNLICAPYRLSRGASRGNTIEPGTGLDPILRYMTQPGVAGQAELSGTTPDGFDFTVRPAPTLNANAFSGQPVSVEQTEDAGGRRAASEPQKARGAAKKKPRRRMIQ